MTKYTNKQKLDAVIRYENLSESINEIAKRIGTSKSVVYNWIKQFQYYGLAAFEKSYTSYTAQFKMDVLNYMNENGASSDKAAVIFKVSSAKLIRKWRNQLNTLGVEALFSKKKGRPSMKKESNKQTKQSPVEGSTEALQAEIERLRMENEYLKKLNALVQAKEKSPRKTK
ncbi:helix-turn-helix domain-containing protein [Cytobacillus horneckiae]|uniref:helix-turn-helix domain-containing protein n=1 Tax=Cytobacillus horneckiae TaxID=549687 RepID=UPI0020424BE2|nr:helix-turn-helix domain-containing protein [Cytobacillus horneckiae]MCM3178515.1 helix-turn-helix domain-containing protein [Cytobacillus horneckiae]